MHTPTVNLARPFQSLTPARDMEVLRALALSDVPRTGRRLAVDAGVAHSTALRILDRLETEGIVYSETAGAARVFRLNDDLGGCLQDSLQAFGQFQVVEWFADVTGDHVL